MKVFWIFAALFGIFALVNALPLSGEQKEDISGDVETPEETPPLEEDSTVPKSDNPWGSKIGNKDKSQVNVIEAPLVCPEGQLIDHNGICRDMW